MNEASTAISANFKKITEEFHSILTSEVKSIAATNNNILTNAIGATNNLMLGINSFGLLSTEVAETLSNHYNTDKDFRRIWGSVSTQFGLSLLGIFGISAKEFSEFIIKYIDLTDVPEKELPSFTQPELMSVRIGTNAYSGVTLLSPNDFWIICVFFARLTWHHNQMFQEMINEHLYTVSSPAQPVKK